MLEITYHMRVVTILTITLALVLVGRPGMAQKSAEPNSTLATVNGIPITTGELDWEMRQLAVEMRLRNRPITDQQVQMMRSQLAENLIEREILYQHARAKNIQIRPQWVEASVSELKEQLGGSSGLQSYLASVGMTQDELKNRLAKGLTVRRLLRRDPIRSIKVSDAEMNAFYRKHPELFQRREQVRVRHILVAVNDLSDEPQRMEGLEKIQNLKNQLVNGADFGVLALEYSDGPSKARAGDLGYLSRDRMIAPFADAAFELQPGMVSDIVETRFGFHLIKMIDRRPPVLLTYKDVREKIERTIRRDKENRAVRSYIAQLKRQSQIERFGRIR